MLAHKATNFAPTSYQPSCMLMLLAFVNCTACCRAHRTAAAVLACHGAHTVLAIRHCKALHDSTMLHNDALMLTMSPVLTLASTSSCTSFCRVMSGVVTARELALGQAGWSLAVQPRATYHAPKQIAFLALYLRGFAVIVREADTVSFVVWQLKSLFLPRMHVAETMC